ncbi:MAG TPA: MFS transporter, partial [Mycobacterium sp.]|nr:MFS transporter [Mycobacterium sp.]
NSPLAVAFMLVAAAITGDNGLPFIAIPEYAGRYWSGRALGTQHTAERVTFAVAPPVFGELITATGYPLAYAMSGLLALAALPFIPVGSRANAGTPSRATADDRPTVR